MFSFFFNDTATTEIYTLSLHDALPISSDPFIVSWPRRITARGEVRTQYAHIIDMVPTVLDLLDTIDRKSTRLNSSHANISYAVFCLKKKNCTSLYNLRPSDARSVV